MSFKPVFKMFFTVKILNVRFLLTRPVYMVRYRAWRLHSEDCKWWQEMQLHRTANNLLIKSF